MASSYEPRPKLEWEVWARHHNDNATRRGEFVTRVEAEAFADYLTTQGYDFVHANRVPDVTPEPITLVIQLDGKTIAEAQALISDLKTQADIFDTGRWARDE